MKLLATSSLVLLSKLASSTTTGYSSKCTDDGYVEITIPYSNEVTAKLLSAVAPSCSVSGESSDKHEYRYDSQAEQAVLKLNIDGCGLGSIYHETRLRSGDYIMAAANVTIGVHDVTSGQDLIFYNAFLGAECGTKTDYTVKFDYAQRIQKHEQEGCDENSPPGQCIVSAYETYDFIFREYSSDFGELVEDDAVHQANNMVYLQLEALNLPADKKFAVKKCDFVDTITNVDDDSTTTERYPMFNAAQGSCANQYIDLALGYDFDGPQMAAQISHRLFLLTRGDQDSYDLECDIKVCDKDDLSSDCNEWSACSDEIANAYMCEGVTCEDDLACQVNDNSASCGSPPSNCNEGALVIGETRIMSETNFQNARFTSGEWLGDQYPAKAIDGYVGGSTIPADANPADEFFVDVGGDAGVNQISKIAVHPRQECCYQRYKDMTVELNDGTISCTPDQLYDEDIVERLTETASPMIFNCQMEGDVVVRNIKVSNLVDGNLVADNVVHIAEIEAYCTAPSP